VDAAEPPRSAPAHRAPPEGWRPLSGLAVTVFVVSLFAVLLSIGGILAVTAFLLIVQAVVLGTVRWSERRGRGLVIAAMVVTLGAGAYGYFASVAVRDAVQDRAAELLAALRGGDARDVESRLDADARAKGAAETIRARYEEVVRAVGPYRGPVEAGGLWFGGGGVFAEPHHGDEIPAPAEGAKGPPDGTVWVVATFEKGPVHVALVPRGAEAAGLMERVGSMQSVFQAKPGTGPWTDVRFYRSP
jgi:hypothetical protein